MGMAFRGLSRHATFALSSFACPLAAVGVVVGYQSIAHAEFWRAITPDESAAGAMMGFSEVIQIFLALFVGCIVGLVFAGLSVRARGHVFGTALAAVGFNGLPLLLLLFLSIRAAGRGGW